jgi:hypothetical protein
MFGFLSMMDNYEDRKVANYSDEKSGLIVDTCAVTDSDEPFETGICHPNYNDGKWVIVEMYSSKEKAQEGHEKWVKIMTAKKLPANLKDVSTCELVKLSRLLDSSEPA